MSFRIVNGDISKIKTDVLVNIEDSLPLNVNEFDITKYERAEDNKRSEAKYVLHLSRPEWIDGKHNELDVLKEKYQKSLQKALEFKCKSILFPLISSKEEFPTDKILEVALSSFNDFLKDNEMKIILFIEDKEAIKLPYELSEDIDSYIDENYAEEDEVFCSENVFEDCSTRMVACLDYIDKKELDVGVSFHEKLFELIYESNLSNKDVWKRANLDRKHFSKIQCDENYHPKKKTIMALCIALELDLDQSKDLLARADWAFSPSSKFDLIVQKAIKDKQYDIMQLNVVLFKYTNEVLGV